MALTRASVKPWVLASRPKTLTAAVVPVLVGVALATGQGDFAPVPALVTLFCAVCIQIGTNFANDVYDFKKGADIARVGPTRVTTAGLLSPHAVEVGTWVVFGLAAVAGLYLVTVGGWPILVIGIASILAGLAYTAGPYPLGYNGLGDVFVFLFFGLAGVVGTYYLQTHTWTLAAVVAAVPVGALVTNIIVVNNLRDVDTDRVVGKRTLAVLIGKDSARIEYIVLAVVAYAAPVFLWLTGGASLWALLPLLTLPLTVRLVRDLYVLRGPALNKALGGTSQLVGLFGVLFALGLLF